MEEPKSINIGFTGTQEGMTMEQSCRFLDIVNNLKHTVAEFHHGDCIGSDIQAHALIVKNYPWVIIHVHPPSNSRKRANAAMKHPNLVNPEAIIVHKPDGYLERNHHIVDATDILIATPREHEEVLRSGTWATVRYAAKKKKPIIKIMPDGELNDFSWLRIKIKEKIDAILETKNLD